VNAALPACTDDGLRLVTVGTAGAIVKIELFDTTPLVLTVTVAAPCVPIRLELTAPVNRLVFPKVVGTAAPFHKIVELAENPEPFTVSVKLGPLACAIDGLMLLITGTGVAGVIVNVELLDVAPLVETATVAVPCAAIRLATIVAVSWLEFPNAVGTVDPFHKIVELAVNPDPFTVRANAAPPV